MDPLCTLVQSENNEEWFICKDKESEMYFNNEEINLTCFLSHVMKNGFI